MKRYPRKLLDNYKIYTLREQGLTYKAIVETLEKQGIKTSLDTVRRICKEIYAIKGETEPKLKKGNPKRIINQSSKKN